jgi:hypothetical protein
MGGAGPSRSERLRETAKISEPDNNEKLARTPRADVIIRRCGSDAIAVARDRIRAARVGDHLMGGPNVPRTLRRRPSTSLGLQLKGIFCHLGLATVAQALSHHATGGLRAHFVPIPTLTRLVSTWARFPPARSRSIPSST